jgi:hypothetical protein
VKALKPNGVVTLTTADTSFKQKMDFDRNIGLLSKYQQAEPCLKQPAALAVIIQIATSGRQGLQQRPRRQRGAVQQQQWQPVQGAAVAQAGAHARGRPPGRTGSLRQKGCSPAAFRET